MVQLMLLLFAVVFGVVGDFDAGVDFDVAEDVLQLMFLMSLS